MSKELASEIMDGLAIPGEVLAALDKPQDQPPQTPQAPAAPTPEPVQPAQAATPAPAQAPAQTPAPQAPKQDQVVPLPTFLDMRDKLKTAERRLAEIEANKPAPQAPSPVQDPAAHNAWLASQINQATIATKFDTSEVIAREKHGDQPVQAAMDWAMQKAASSPAFAAEYLQQKHPIDWAVKQHKRTALMDEIGDDLDGYISRKVAEKLQTAPAPQAQPSPAAVPQPAASQAQPSPPRSLASAPNAGGTINSVPTHGTAAIDAAFR